MNLVSAIARRVTWIDIVGLCMVALISVATVYGQEPKVRLQKMSDAEYKELNDASDARVAAAKAYFAAESRYAKIHGDIEEKYNATPVQPTCENSSNRSIEWKGQYLVIDERPSTVGCGYFTFPSVGTTLQGSTLAAPFYAGPNTTLLYNEPDPGIHAH